MAGVEIRNTTVAPFALPFPLGGVLGPGKACVVNATAAILLSYGIANGGGLVINDVPNYTGPYSAVNQGNLNPDGTPVFPPRSLPLATLLTFTGLASGTIVACADLGNAPFYNAGSASAPRWQPVGGALVHDVTGWANGNYLSAPSGLGLTAGGGYIGCVFRVTDGITSGFNNYLLHNGGYYVEVFDAATGGTGTADQLVVDFVSANDNRNVLFTSPWRDGTYLRCHGQFAANQINIVNGVPFGSSVDNHSAADSGTTYIGTFAPGNTPAIDCSIVSFWSCPAAPTKQQILVADAAMRKAGPGRAGLLAVCASLSANGWYLGDLSGTTLAPAVTNFGSPVSFTLTGALTITPSIVPPQ